MTQSRELSAEERAGLAELLTAKETAQAALEAADPHSAEWDDRINASVHADRAYHHAALAAIPSLLAAVERLGIETTMLRVDRDDARAERDKALIATVSRLAAVEAELKKAYEALKPFADEADAYDPDEGDGNDIAWASDFPIGALRRARSALSSSTTAKGGEA